MGLVISIKKEVDADVERKYRRERERVFDFYSIFCGWYDILVHNETF